MFMGRPSPPKRQKIGPWAVPTHENFPVQAHEDSVDRPIGRLGQLKYRKMDRKFENFAAKTVKSIKKLQKFDIFDA